MKKRDLKKLLELLHAASAEDLLQLCDREGNGYEALQIHLCEGIRGERSPWNKDHISFELDYSRR